jgi:hypothetical protein
MRYQIFGERTGLKVSSSLLTDPVFRATEVVA